MKDNYKRALRIHLANHFAQTRFKRGMTQAEFSEQLLMDPRSYAALERGENFCCALTFILYLVFLCDNPAALIRDLRRLLISVRDSEHPAS